MAVQWPLRVGCTQGLGIRPQRTRPQALRPHQGVPGGAAALASGAGPGRDVGQDKCEDPQEPCELAARTPAEFKCQPPSEEDQASQSPRASAPWRETGSSVLGSDPGSHCTVQLLGLRGRGQSLCIGAWVGWDGPDVLRR